MKNKKILGVLSVLFSGILWGHSGFFVKTLGIYNASDLTISFLRVVFTVVEMTVVMLIFNRKVFKVSLKHIPILLVSGMIGIVGSSLFYFVAIDLTSLSLAAVLMYTAPTIVMLLSLIIFKEKLTFKKVLCVVVAFLGSMLSCGIFSSQSSFTIKGIAFGCLAGLSYALYSISSSIAIKKNCEPLTITVYSFIFALIPMLAVGDIPQVINSVKQAPEILGISAIQAFLTCLLPYVLYTIGLRFVSPTYASIISTIELVTASAIGFVSFNEKLDIFSILGIILIISSILILNIRLKKE